MSNSQVRVFLEPSAFAAVVLIFRYFVQPPVLVARNTRKMCFLELVSLFKKVFDKNLFVFLPSIFHFFFFPSVLPSVNQQQMSSNE